MDVSDSDCFTHHILIDPTRSTKGGSVPSAAELRLFVVCCSLFVGSGNCPQSRFPEPRVGALLAKTATEPKLPATLNVPTPAPLGLPTFNTFPLKLYPCLVEAPFDIFS